MPFIHRLRTRNCACHPPVALLEIPAFRAGEVDPEEDGRPALRFRTRDFFAASFGRRYIDMKSVFPRNPISSIAVVATASS